MSVKIKWMIGTFLVLGTILSLYIAVSSWHDMFYVHTTWMYRDGWQLLVGIIVDFALLANAGFVSSVSFFRNGMIWKPIIKGVIINIALLLLLLIYCCIRVISVGSLYGILVIVLIVLPLWRLYVLWKYLCSYHDEN